MNEPFDTIEETLADIAAGKLVIVTDDENRENEGDLVMAASKATPQTVNMMIRHARGLICVPTVEHQLRRLGISQMVPENRESQRTAFAVAVDAAEGMVKWCRENAALSGLAKAPIRYIADDCLKFVRREYKRGRRYDAIIMDPPTYGRGSTGEMWKLEDHLWELMVECRALLTESPLFFLLNAYTARLSPTVVANLLSESMTGCGGTITAGEVGLSIKRDGKILPCGIYGRWEA